MVQDGPAKRKKKFCRLRFFPSSPGISPVRSPHICRGDRIGLQKRGDVQMNIHVVRPGDTVTSIAAQYGVDARRLAADNDVGADGALAVGQTLVVRFPETVHVIRPGETLFSLAAAYGTTVRRLWQNNWSLGGESALQPGQTLVIAYADAPPAEAVLSGYAYPSIAPALQQQLDELPPLRKEEIIESVEIAVKYAGYITRERTIADKLQRLEHIPLRGRVDYNTIHTISTEARQKLTRIDPETIGQAARIPGISPNDVNILLVLLGR